MNHYGCKIFAGTALAFCLALAGCGDRRAADVWQGYIRADMIHVGAPVSGWLDELAVARGGNVSSNDLLFRLASEPETYQLGAAAAGARRIDAQLADMQKGARAEDIAVLKDAADQALAAMQLAELDLRRVSAMYTNNFVPASEHDAAVHNWRQAQAAHRQAVDRITQAQLAARPDLITAMVEQSGEQAAALAERQWRLGQKEQRSRVAATVYDVLYQPGEWVPAGAPVAVLLAPALVRVRFFVRQPVAATLKLGESVRFSQIPGGDMEEAVVDYISPVPEYTPPVIFSRDTSAKQVFMVEAAPKNPRQALHPGLPVEVRK